jgi:hypothetical protein
MGCLFYGTMIVFQAALLIAGGKSNPGSRWGLGVVFLIFASLMLALALRGSQSISIAWQFAGTELVVLVL